MRYLIPFIIILTACTPQIPESSFLIITDTHSHFENIDKAMSYADQHNIKTIFHLGDHVENGSDKTEWAAYHDHIKERNLLAIPGNHDYPYFTDYFTTNQSIQIDNIHFILLDSNNPEQQLHWLENELQKPSPQTLILMHHPFYTDCEKDPRAPCVQKITNLLEQYPVQAVFSGHVHHFERSYPIIDQKRYPDGITYFSSGGISNTYGTPNNYWTADSFTEPNFLRIDNSEDGISVTVLDLEGNTRAYSQVGS